MAELLPIMVSWYKGLLRLALDQEISVQFGTRLPMEELNKLSRYSDCPLGRDLQPGDDHCVKCSHFVDYIDSKRLLDFTEEEWYILCKFNKKD